VLTDLEPVDADMAAVMLARARADRRRVTPAGAGSKRAWCRHQALRDAASDGESHGDLTLSLRSLTAPLHHYAGDLVATIPAGVTLAAANQTLALAKQWLPLDPAYADRATIGGIVATNDSGPRRHRFGAPRDLIVGIEVALTDGRVVRAGGRVVKNVAGYDLSRLFCGSMGALGVITSATFKLAPLPAASRTVVIRAASPATAAELARAIDALPVTPTAIEISGNQDSRVLVRFETTPQAADRMAATLQQSYANLAIVAGEDEARVWREHHDAVWEPSHTVVKVSVLPTGVGPVLESLSGLANVRWTVAGRAALGVLLLALHGEPAAVAAAVAAIRTQAAAAKGTVQVLQASPLLREHLGPSRVDSPLNGVRQAVKARFDPDNTLPDLT
jgi:glycolate oxidase FAD binding subunit